ncbi:hypothetical protein [Roseivivax sp. CAU 1753]
MGQSKEIEIVPLIIFAAFWVGCAGTTAFVANEKGRDGISWFLSGIFFGFFALAAVAASPSAWEKPPGRASRDESLSSHEKRVAVAENNNDQDAPNADDNLWVYGIFILILLIGAVGLLSHVL